MNINNMRTTYEKCWLTQRIPTIFQIMFDIYENICYNKYIYENYRGAGAMSINLISAIVRFQKGVFAENAWFRR